MQFRRFATTASVALASILLLSSSSLSQVQQNTTGMTVDEFEIWAEVQRHKPDENTRTHPVADAVILRLQSGKTVSDKTVLATVFAWSESEQSKTLSLSDPQKKEAKSAFPGSEHFIEQVIPLLKGRVSLQTKLQEWKSRLFRLEHDDAGEVETYYKGLQLLNQSPASVNIDQWRVEGALDWSGVLYEVLGENKKAESLLLEVLEYPLWKFSKPAQFAYFKLSYVDAGQRLIEIRKRDLKALQSTYFYDMAKDELAPLLENAIKAAGGQTVGGQNINFYPPGLEDVLLQQSSEQGLVASQVEPPK